MKKFLMAAAALALMGSVAFAGPNAGGTLIVHNPGVNYVGPGDYCGQGAPPATCEGANTEISGSDNQVWVWKIYAAFAPCSAPRLKGVQFGITYGQFGNGGNIVLTDHAACIGDLNNGAFESPLPGWPNPNTGDAIIFQYTQTNILTECYWFAGYAYYGGADMFTLYSGPGQQGQFVDDNVPINADPIAGYGSLGFNQPGSVSCPSAAAQGACCNGPNCTITCESDCQGQWMGGPCDPNPCPQPVMGACCDQNGNCTQTTEADCHGVQWLSGVSCDPNPCAVPTKIESWGQIKHAYR